jgi:hypothetical protein
VTMETLDIFFNHSTVCVLEGECMEGRLVPCIKRRASYLRQYKGKPWNAQSALGNAIQNQHFINWLRTKVK